MKKPNNNGWAAEKHRFGAASGSLRNLSLLDAAGANTHPRAATIDFRPNALQVWQPAAARPVVGVADIIAAYRLLTANFTNFGHYCSVFCCFLENSELIIY